MLIEVLCCLTAGKTLFRKKVKTSTERQEEKINNSLVGGSKSMFSSWLGGSFLVEKRSIFFFLFRSQVFKDRFLGRIISFIIPVNVVGKMVFVAHSCASGVEQNQPSSKLNRS